jgi:lysophospholipase L1-like esterase
VLLIFAAPVVFVLICDLVIRWADIDTDLVRNESFRIAVPVWALGDPNWVDIQKERNQRPRGVRAADVAWLQNFEEARYIQYKLKPNISVDAGNPFNEIELRRGTTFRIESNSSGFRTKEFETKNPNVIRIVTLGDSSTFGWGVDSEYTYQQLLETRLRSDGVQAELLNVGISGHTTRHGLGVFEHYVRDLEPDGLIISYGANDARFVLQSVEEILALDDTWLGTARTTFLRFETFKLLRRWILGAYDPFMARESNETDSQERVLVKAVPTENYIENLRYLISETRSRGAETVLLSMCSPEEYVDAMRHVSEIEGVPFVDAGEIFRVHIDDLRAHRLYVDEVRYYERLYGERAMSADWQLYVTTDGCHPGRAGHSLIADVLKDVFREQREALHDR